MLEKFVEKIASMSGESHILIDGLDYKKSDYRLVEEPTVSPLNISTMKGLVEYIDSGLDGNGDDTAVHVVGHDCVRLITNINTQQRSRETLAEVSLIGDSFRFGQYLSTEDFIIGMHSMFRPTEDQEYVLKCCAGLSIKSDATAKDDGMAQHVEMKTGIHTVSGEKIKPVVSLMPIRTFREIEDQPESSFIFRVRQENGEVSCGLFEADGGAWKIDAVNSIKEWLSDELSAIDSDIPVIG